MSMSWEVFRRSLVSRRTARRFDNAVDDGDAAKPTTSGTPLMFESLEPRLLLAAFGSRVYVRFDHDWEPIGQQVWRRMRQLLLSRFTM